MQKRMVAVLVALAMTWTGRIVPLQAQSNLLNVKLDGVSPGAPVSIAVNVAGVPSATARGTATAKGEALMALDLGNLGKQVDVQVDVYAGKCADDSVRAFIVAAGQVPPDQCGRKKIGAFFVNRQHNITIHFPDKLAISQGLLTPRNALIGGGALGGILIIVAASGSDNSGGTGGTGGNGGNGGNGGTTIVPGDVNGTYTGTGTKANDTCGTFTPTSPISGVLNINASGTGSWIKTHTAAAITFTFSVILGKESSDTYVFSGTTTQMVSGASFTVRDQGSIKAKTMTLSQTFTRDVNPCTAAYNMTLTRP